MQTFLAATGVVLVAIGTGFWLAGIGAWGLVAYVAVLSGAIVWSLASDALRRRADRLHDESAFVGYETVHWLRRHRL